MGGAEKRKVRARLSATAPASRKRARGGGGGEEEEAVAKNAAVGRYIRALEGGVEEEDADIAKLSEVAKAEKAEKAEKAKPKTAKAEKAQAESVSDSGEESGSESGSGSGSEGSSSSSSEGEDAAVTAEASGVGAVVGLGAVKGLKAAAGELPNVHVTVVLEAANLEAVKLPGAKGGHALLSSEEHGTLLRKMKRDPNDARPDITHQCLLTLMDSPLNKAGKLTVYIRTKRNALIRVHAATRIPRTIRRFSGLMVELIQRLKVRSTNGTEPLLQVIRNPIVSHLPLGQKRIACTYNCENIVDVREHARDTVEEEVRQREVAAEERERKVPDEERQDEEVKDKGEPVQVLYVVGAMAHGKVDVDYADEEVCLSEYPLSAATVCARIAFTYECMMGIL